MSKFFLSLLMLLFITCTFGQNAFKRNTIYGELMGNGIFISLNYERQLKSTPGLGVRLGLGHHSGDEEFRFSFPIGVNYLFNLKNNRSFLDAGIGTTWSVANGLRTSIQDSIKGRNESERIWNLVPSLGYRHHTRYNLMWRTSFTPIINKYRVIPWIGLSIGMCF